MKLQLSAREYQRFHFIKGFTKSVVYDLKSHKAYHLNEVATKIIENVLNKSSKCLLDDDQEIREVLLNIGLLDQEGNINSEIVRIGNIPNQPLKKIWIELTNRCNQKCIHCYAESSPLKDEGARSETITKFLDDCLSLGCEAIQFTGGRPFGRGLNKNIMCQEYKNCRSEPNFESTPRTFIYSKKYNSCWGNMLFFRYDAKVVPCPHARSLIIGDYIRNSFSEILETALSTVWSITMDNIEVCQECEYRYFCDDCRPLAYGSCIESLFKKNLRCTYNPYTGTW